MECWSIGVVVSEQSHYSTTHSSTTPLFGWCECPVQPGLATIGGVAMNDPALGRFVDSRNRLANLIGGALWR